MKSIHLQQIYWLLNSKLEEQLDARSLNFQVKIIEMSYGKSEADSFKGSNNWFQRFKKRYGLVLRRRTNKKKNGADDAGKSFRSSIKTWINPLKHTGEETNDPSILNMEDGLLETGTM